VDYPAVYRSGITRLQIVGAASQDLGGIGGVAAAVPGEEAAGGVAVHGVEFFAEEFAADGEALFGIAEGAKECAVEAHFAGDLSHDLHEAPGEAAGVGFRGCDFVVGEEVRDVSGEEGGLVAHGPIVPGGFLFDDGADQGWVERLGGGGFASEHDELGWGGHFR
jgi:hypothetical protein